MKHLSCWLASAGLALAALTGIAGATGVDEACAATEKPGDPEKPRAKARLIAEHAALVPGSTAYLGVTFDIEQGWHLYWDGASDTGMPIQVDAGIPAGLKSGELQWPAPKRHVAPGDLLDYIYEDRVTLLLPVTVPADAKPGDQVRFTARLDWLECKDYCLPGEADLELTLPIAGAAETPAKSPDAARFAEARERLPRPLPEADVGVELSWKGPTLTIRAPGAVALAFYPKAASAPMVRPIRDGAAKGDVLSIEFEPRAGGEKSGAVGVLEITHADGRTPTVYAVEAPGPSAR